MVGAPLGMGTVKKESVASAIHQATGEALMQKTSTHTHTHPCVHTSVKVTDGPIVILYTHAAAVTAVHNIESPHSGGGMEATMAATPCGKQEEPREG